MVFARPGLARILFVRVGAAFILRRAVAPEIAGETIVG